MQCERPGDTRYHVDRIKGMLSEAMDHARHDVECVDDPEAKAMFETTAEVLGGLRQAYERFERGSTPARR
ncbi:MAG: hypothetical protein IBX62_08450 [Coriobacteriia bacterium]|nr:hypothetical protein [Coriobacteriia bacterium]